MELVGNETGTVLSRRVSMAGCYDSNDPEDRYYERMLGKYLESQEDDEEDYDFEEDYYDPKEEDEDDYY